MTSLPASRMGLADRGTLREGAWADIAVFDLEHMSERGTVEAPSQLATGMAHVLVNGHAAVRDSQFADQRAGQVLRASN